MFALITPSVMKAVTRVFNPPSPTSLTTTVPREPSSKPITRLAQFSTSTGSALIHWFAPASRARFGSLAMDQVRRVGEHRHGPDAFAQPQLAFPLLQMQAGPDRMHAHAQQRTAPG